MQAPAESRLFECLKQFGAPIHLLTPEDLLQPDFVFHFGVPPWRVDILTSIPGVDFDAAYRERVALPLGERGFSCISRECLMKSKEASGRPQHLLDLEMLRRGGVPGQ